MDEGHQKPENFEVFPANDYDIQNDKYVVPIRGHYYIGNQIVTLEAGDVVDLKTSEVTQQSLPPQ